MTRTCVLAFALLAAAATQGATRGAAQGSGQAQALTAGQREEVVQLLRQTLREDPSILREALMAMQADDARLQQSALAKAITAQHAALTENPADAVAGNPDGTVSVVEFYDPRCPYCRQMLPVLAALEQSDRQVRIVYKDIPILGPASVLETHALLAAQRQGGYLKLQDAVMRNAATPTMASLRAEAVTLGLDGAQWERDMANPADHDRIEANLRLASALHIEGTPALVIGTQMISGAIDLPDLQRAVAAARAN